MKLKPCPFCGNKKIMIEMPMPGEPLLHHFEPDNLQGGWIEGVACEECGACIREAIYFKKRVVERWNTRV